jgi:serine/threonine-protein kinase
MARHIKTPPRPINEVTPDAHVPPEVEALVMRLLSKEPEKRPDSAEAMIAELTRVKEIAVVTSGVRASIANGLELVLDRSPRSVPPPPAAPTPSALAQDTLSVPAGLPPKSRRWLVPTLLLGFLTASAVTVLVVASGWWRSPASASAGATRPSATAALSAPLAATTVAAAATTGSASARPSAVPTAPTLLIPTVAASALPLPHPDPTRPERNGRPRQGSRPAGTSSVGYGYLE